MSDQPNYQRQRGVDVPVLHGLHTELDCGCDHPGFVYMIAFHDAGLMKIGFSAQPERRMYEVQPPTGEAWNPCLVAAHPGCFQLESATLKHYTALCHKGEWFHLDGELRQLAAMAAIHDDLAEREVVRRCNLYVEWELAGETA